MCGRLLIKPLSGTRATMGIFGTQFTQKSIGSLRRYEHTPALTVERNTRHAMLAIREITSAIRIAKLLLGEGGFAMKVKGVSYAGKADVFNMEVEDTHDFVIQGGVISHNCADEVRYCCMSRPIKPRAAIKPDEYAKTPMAMFLDIPKDSITVSRRPRMEVIDGDKEKADN